MHYPHFYDTLPAITLKDELAELLGACEDGIITFSYLDAVKIAGHSCPTVLGAYMMLQRGINKLYDSHMPKRGEIVVEFRDAQDSGVTGVMANLATAITGATSDFGFGGLGGKYSRKSLLFFNAPIKGIMRLTRTDTSDSVTLDYDTSSIPKSPRTAELMPKILQSKASEQEKADFQKLWQNGVEAIAGEIDRFIKIM
ncbi:MAG: hypothetical protein IE916_07940 [Epsilonproteobacteria bacterium]|nr:hypothetical protein [Campylobacterota bacterium]